jgi:hypothetical protein
LKDERRCGICKQWFEPSTPAQEICEVHPKEERLAYHAQTIPKRMPRQEKQALEKRSKAGKKTGGRRKKSQPARKAQVANPNALINQASHTPPPA